MIGPCFENKLLGEIESQEEEINAMQIHDLPKYKSKYDRPWKQHLNMEDDINDFVEHTVIHYLEDLISAFATCITHSTKNNLCFIIKCRRIKIIETYHTNNGLYIIINFLNLHLYIQYFILTPI